MYIKRDKLRIEKIVLDLHDVIVGSRKVVLFEYAICTAHKRFKY